MKTIFILCDTLNRRMLSAYGAGKDAAITPNIDRLARRSVVFDSHWCGSGAVHARTPRHHDRTAELS